MSVLNRVCSSRLTFPHSVVLGFAVSIASQCPYAKTTTPLTPGHRANIRAEVLTAAPRVHDLPATVREAMRAAFSERTLRLADPLEPFQANPWQMVLSPHAPSRRLIRAGCGPDHCLVHYEEGGYHHSFRVLVLGLNRHDAQIEWVGRPSRPLANEAALKAFVVQE